jgi:hypothetical protein
MPATMRPFTPYSLQKTCDPVMTAYKMVKVDAPIWGIGWKLEQTVIQVSSDTF